MDVLQAVNLAQRRNGTEKEGDVKNIDFSINNFIINMYISVVQTLTMP